MTGRRSWTRSRRSTSRARTNARRDFHMVVWSARVPAGNFRPAGKPVRRVQ
jgi:hypothetical protein